MKAIAIKKAGRSKREKEVLLGLTEHYLNSGKPIGSNTLKETGFEHLSSATIRNYFAELEKDGYLLQTHTSGGRIPTEKAFRFYAAHYLGSSEIDEHSLIEIAKLKQLSTKNIANILRNSLDLLSRLTSTAAFISAPRFDRDFVTDIKVLPIDSERCLFVLVTDFGTIQTEVLQTKEKLTSFSAKRIESYLHARLTGAEFSQVLDPEEELFAKEYYNEVMVRFLIGYSNFAEEEILWHGLSQMLHYPEFRDPALLAEGMSLFENSTGMRHLTRDTCSHNSLKFWIGDDLSPFSGSKTLASVIAIPYKIHNQPVGAIGLLGPLRIPYKQFFGILKALSESLSECLTKNLYKFKLSFRQPSALLKRIEQKPIKLIEHRTKP